MDVRQKLALLQARIELCKTLGIMDQAKQLQQIVPEIYAILAHVVGELDTIRGGNHGES